VAGHCSWRTTAPGFS